MHTNYTTSPVLVLLAALCIAGCGTDADRDTLFVRVPETVTNISFENELPRDPSFNIINYLYYYDGGGVAVGDINNDGLVDVYFTANLGPNKLYLNKGNFVFEDITAQAGIAGEADWTTGVAMADVNGDGYLDIYVSAVDYLGMEGKNALYINNGDGTFTNRAEAYGLDHRGYSTQAAFFDYDLDGDLDVYLLNHSVHTEGTYGRATLRNKPHPKAGDKLYRNDGGHFTDVTEQAGIYSGVVGYGLGVVISDLNLDGCPDIYVANDFHENDYLYYNNCDGTFTESIRAATGHVSRSSMGVDAADYNNDGQPDIAVLDMMPDRMQILKTANGAEPYDIYRLKRKFGYYHQYPRNTLQLNRGRGHFSEIGYLAGVYATDWSWAPLFCDLDNDGFKDLFITNGIYRRPNDLDYINYVSQRHVQVALKGELTEEDMAVIDKMPQVPISNYAFHNNGDLTFTNKAQAWGLDHPGFSNGAAYADLDNDGDLDLVLNNLNAPAAIYKNRADSLTDHHYLTVKLEGSGKNTFGIGAKVIIQHDGRLQLLEQMLTRGYQSSVDPRLHFGLGDSEMIDSLTVIWPDRSYQVLTNVPADQMITLHQENAAGTYSYDSPAPDEPLFVDVTDKLDIDYTHQENRFVDFTREPLMPHKLSMEGPALAVGDVNGDGLDDFYVGGAKWQPGRLMVQTAEGRFVATNENLWQADSLYEDVDAAFFDAEGDGDLDLYVVSGGNEFWGQADALQDRLYLNDGRGGFRRASNALPEFYANGSCVAPADYDGDGDIDLFIGSRVVARNYGRTPESYLLENDGTGRFTDVTARKAPELAKAGMVTDAVWTDYNGDGRLDLIVVGEWMPIRVFEQHQGRFIERTAAAGLAQTHGWWNAVAAADMDGDGDMDLVAGNLGLNTRLKAGPDQPLRLYLNDFDEDGRLDQILTYYHNGKSYPFATLDQLARQFESFDEKFPTYAAFGDSQIEDLFSSGELAEARVKRATVLASSYLENNGDGTFDRRNLPMKAQFTPIYAIAIDDFDGDGRRDLIVGGNFYGVKPRLGRYDAGYGLFLRGDGSGSFDSIEPVQSNLWLSGQVRAVEPLTRAGGRQLLLIARNGRPLQVVRVER